MSLDGYYGTMLHTITVSRIITGWMGVMTVLMCVIANESTTSATFYRFGPQSDLIILGYTIDTVTKYGLVILYALINTVVRNLNHNVIAPWVTLNIQDDAVDKRNVDRAHAYEISIASTVYSWFDWLIYIHMLLAQVDMVIIEMGADVAASTAITYWYLEKSPSLSRSTIAEDASVKPGEYTFIALTSTNAPT